MYFLQNTIGNDSAEIKYVFFLVNLVGARKFRLFLVLGAYFEKCKYFLINFFLPLDKLTFLFSKLVFI